MPRRPESPAAQPVLPVEIEGTLALAIAPRMPPESLRERVLQRARGERQRFLTVRSTDGHWQMLSPDVAVKHLEDDGTMQSFLLRLDPGARLPPHEHPIADELCVVLEGTVRIGAVEASAGDFHLAFAGSAHGELASPGGCLLFLRTASGTIPHR